MPRPRYKSRTFRRVAVRTPGSKNKIHYKRRKPSKAKCGKCGSLLKGVPRELPYKIRTTAKTKKRPQRPFGGNLCSLCTRKELVKRSRK